MLNLPVLAAFLASSAFVAADPSFASEDLDKRAACTFTSAATAIAQKAGCSSITLNSIAVPAGTTLDLTGLATGTKVIFEGTTTFGYSEWEGPLVSISGTNIVVTGASGNKLDGGGARWWDKLGSNVSAGNGKVKPKFFSAHKLLGSSSITGLNFLNAPVQCISIGSSVGLSLININIDNSAGDAGELAHNTDAFDINLSQNIFISGAVVKNQDDCVAINSGSNITFTGGNCSGGHGLSVGSVGGRSGTGANDVSDVKFLSSTISKSSNGARIKAVSNQKGTIKGVTYKDITLVGITGFGIVIEQDYQNGSPTGTPTDGVPITGVTMDNVHGTVSGGQNTYILCANCSGWTWNKVAITGGTVKKACKGIPTGASC
ncbi:43ce29d6-2ad0-4120-85a4-98f414027884 [Sclerotinia trifoliorum]|uniref:endo-polygalacturonase n=1 Tax=Sclerotinia trifoliorum TaxID=28548 RepID=A0A8H2VMY9_9HELO|nr:43ce29d6-2ad0-4120-85a4-98f414027884 [Sclerotinia trifoliorum]